MEPSIMWTTGAILTMAPTIYTILMDMAKCTWIPGEGWDEKPKESDWAFSAFIALFICAVAWPVTAVISAVRYYQTREKRAELKRILIRQRNDNAFYKLKEAQQCLMDHKRYEHKVATARWTNEFNAADTKRNEAIRRSRLEHEQRRIERERERIVEESMYREATDYSTAYSCPHGHSSSYRCWYC